MSLSFEKPEAKPDWEEATYALARILIAAMIPLEPVAGAKAAVSIVPNARKISAALNRVEKLNPHNIAWIWLSHTLAESLAIFIREMRAEFVIQAHSLDATVNEFIVRSLEVPCNVSFDETAIIAPARHPVFASARGQIGEVLSKLTLSNTFEIEHWQRVFEDCLEKASFLVVARNVQTMGPVLEAITGPASASVRRKIALNRHYQWLNRRFYHEPVFSPDGEVETSLGELYLRQRAIWHKKYEKLSQDRDEPETYYEAHLADLHETIDQWLNENGNDRLRIVAGGPGSGKSSFAKALAAEMTQSNKYSVVFVELQRMQMTGELYKDLGSYFQFRNRTQGSEGSAGFMENPLDWGKWDGRPILIIFDGLDEITQDTDKAAEISKNFLLNVGRLVDNLNQDGTQIKALVLGRDLACQEGMKAASIPLECMLNVAPIRALKSEDLVPRTFGFIEQKKVHVPELDPHLARDQRPEYWDLWCTSNGEKGKEPPESITAESLSSLNVEPLLLHLLILSDFSGTDWPIAAKNRNVVYEDILEKIHQRNVKEKKPGHQLSSSDFLLLMECLGLAAWHGNLRTGTDSSYLNIREIHARSLANKGAFDHADMQSMILSTHARKVEGVETGFEFIHKSFGEYLVARALVTLAHRTKRRRINAEDPAGEYELCSEWVKLVGSSEVTTEILKFLEDEINSIEDPKNLSDLKDSFQDLLVWVQKNGMPVSGDSYRQAETAQRCSETALLVVGAALSLQNMIINEDPSVIDFGWSGYRNNDFGLRLIYRLDAHLGHAVSGFFTGLDFTQCNLTSLNLTQADFRGSKFEYAKLNEANLNTASFENSNMQYAKLLLGSFFGVTFDGADLSESNMMAAHFRNVSFDGSNVSNAELRRSHLYSVSFCAAKMIEADLAKARLTQVDFSGADIENANFLGAYLLDCDLRKSLNLTQEMLDSMFGIRVGPGSTQIPEHLTYPEFWYIEPEDSKNDENRFGVASPGFNNAYEKWYQLLDAD